ncbi:MAG: hypothetical protein RMJ98_21490, partial [Myxococcales bacterium]|nr:hypothetical protein [Myxococcales bacterium]
GRGLRGIWRFPLEDVPPVVLLAAPAPGASHRSPSPSRSLAPPAPGASSAERAFAAELQKRMRIAEARRRVERLRTLWGRGVVVGGTLGVGAPAGLAGFTAQINPSPRWGVSWAGGVGGLGAAAAVQVWWRPLIPGDEWAPTLGAGFSVNVTPAEQRALPDRQLPLAARWFNVEVASEWRFTSGRLLRVGLGHGFLLNGSAFRCREGADGPCDAASESNVPGWAPYGGGLVRTPDLIVANAQGKPVHLWFLHIDFGAIFPFE